MKSNSDMYLKVRKFLYNFAINIKMSSLLNKYNSCLKPPKSPLLRRSTSGEINCSYIKDMSDGGIELIVPNISKDNVSNISRADSAPVFCSIPMPSFKIAKEPQDIANEIDRKSRIIFPISFLIVNIIYWTTLALLSHY
jgi:hypothetical protein